MWSGDGEGEVGSVKGEGCCRGSRVEVSWSWFGHVGVSAPGPLFPCAGGAFLALFAPGSDNGGAGEPRDLDFVACYVVGCRGFLSVVHRVNYGWGLC